MKPLTIVYITARDKPCVEWFILSLANQVKAKRQITVVIVDSQYDSRLTFTLDLQREEPRYIQHDGLFLINHISPKPTIWQGPHRITKENWWGAANARNTGICYCETEWIAFLDDRCVLMPTWLEAVDNAMKENYVVCGAYQKRTGIKVQSGVITHSGIVIGEDSREDYLRKHRTGDIMDCPGEWAFGCTLALPVEWALRVNGYPEICDGLGMEDAIFGWLLANKGFPMKYDARMKMIEDRTPEFAGPVMRREDKGVSPNDKSHALLEKFRGQKTSMNKFDLRQMRSHCLNGRGLPLPVADTVDWYDGQPICEFK